MSRGVFISFEGIEGCGKTTQARLLKSYLEEKGILTLLTREPGGTEVSEQIRSILKDPKNKALTSRAELFLFLASRAQHVEEIIEPALKKGKVVISDRFTDATLAYQGYGRGFDLDLLDKLNQAATGGLKPDLTLVFDLTPEVGLTRIRSRSLFDRFEREEVEFHRRIREGYLALARQFPRRVKVVNAETSIEGVFEAVKGIVALKIAYVISDQSAPGDSDGL